MLEYNEMMSMSFFRFNICLERLLIMEN
jgi:hypothetical protein